MSDFRDMLTSDGKSGSKLSSKRVITFAAFICMVIAFFANLVWAIVVEPSILNGMIGIVMAGLGVTVGEHLLKKRNDNNSGNFTPKDDNSSEY
jgi:xanthine/uracil permease